ncbi:MAG: ABC transporter permease [Gracilimonas sp.]|uniref:ABC transporter permease n=1 Tax=Gracilimonas TaxID=649462 RepID=UPI001B2DFD60|nr:ABC transporter permease [Gracilimonas sp.]MBO6585360.1 ABC transporter permease [Gracilimonas sp.]MBO6616356.1 ABC transporter permease [Gracilimonas sp.]
MLKNYIKIAWRNFRNNKSYSLINVLGLAIGLCCLILISLFVTDELSYDQFHENSEQIYFVGRESSYGSNTNKGLSTQYPVGPAMKNVIPEVDDFLITLYKGSGDVSVNGEDFSEEDRIIHASESFFRMFSFPLKIGQPETVLSDPKSVVITEEIAEKYFGDENPIGRTLLINRYEEGEFIVTGVAENMQQNSYLNFDIVASINNTSYSKTHRDSWGSSMFNTYVQLQEGSTWSDISPKVSELVIKNMGEESTTSFFSIPISDLYLSEHSLASGFKGDRKYIYIFSAIALFILILACINYMNLSTARAMQRSREVGVRKVVGAGKTQLIMQFIGEAVLVAVFAFILGLFIAELALPFFNNFVEKELLMTFKETGSLLSLLFLTSIGVGVLSGSYPAFFLSRFKPSIVLKAASHQSSKGGGFRRMLVTLQFVVSTALIICTLIAFNQLQFVLEKDLGFEDDQVMYIPAHQIRGNIETFKEIALNHSAVIHASATTDIPSRFGMRTGQAFDPDNPDNQFYAHSLRTDADYDDVLNLEMAAGRFFDENRITDRNKARVINEAMVKKLGWGNPDSAVNRMLSDSSTIVGVVKDFHFKSLHSNIGPVYIRMKPTDPNKYNSYNMLAIKFHPEQAQSLISYLQEEWTKLWPEDPLTYHFLDDKFAEQYATDQKLSRAFTAFAAIAIFIACLGLFGLAAFSAERRTKEIGIRKVLGATVSNIVALLSKDFILLVLTGFAIAIPIAWYAMNQWLADFAYRIEIGPGIFALAGGAALIIALLTVSWQSIKAAVANPVDSLRSE